MYTQAVPKEKSMKKIQKKSLVKSTKKSGTICSDSLVQQTETAKVLSETPTREFSIQSGLTKSTIQFNTEAESLGAELPEIRAEVQSQALSAQNPLTQSQKARDSRLPAPGTVILKKYHGQVLEIKVLEAGFEYQGKTYKSISRVAMEIVKRPISGYVFFGLVK